MTDLLNCPFCGGRGIPGTTLDNAGYVMCASEDCWGMTGYLPTEAEAIAAWNRRSLSSDSVSSAKRVELITNAMLHLPIRGRELEFAAQQVDLALSQAGAFALDTVSEASKGGEYDPDAPPDHSADNAADFILRELATALKVDFRPAEGSETWEGDVLGTMWHALTDSGVIDEWDNSLCVQPKKGDSGTDGQEPDGSEAAAIEIADAVLTWLVKHDFLDADAEYRDDDVIEVLNDLIDAPQPKAVTEVATHRHKKRGTEYVLICIGKMQVETWEQRNTGNDSQGPYLYHQSVDMREVAIYRSVDDGSLWVRPREEFEDGRFEALSKGQSDGE